VSSAGNCGGADGRLGAQSRQALDRQHLLAEDLPEVPRRLVGKASRVGKPSGLLTPCLQAGHCVVGNAAGNDQRKVAEVGGDVEGEAVRGDAARDVNADGGDLALLLRAIVRSAGHQTPVRPQMRPARTPKPPQRRISASSMPRTKSTGPMRPPLGLRRVRRSKMG
jgi:hypothetical protein